MRLVRTSICPYEYFGDGFALRSPICVRKQSFFVVFRDPKIMTGLVEVRGGPHEVFHPWMRRGVGLTRIRCLSVVAPSSSSYFLFMTSFGIMGLGSSGSPRKQNFVPDLFPRLPQALSTTPKHFFKDVILITKIRNPQNRPEDQQLGPKPCQDESPRQNIKFPPMFDQHLAKFVKYCGKSSHFYAPMGWLCMGIEVFNYK